MQSKKWPWELTGISFSPLPDSVDEALELTDLNYKVELYPLRYIIGKMSYLVDNRFAVVRSDTNQLFGIVGNRYKPIQVADAFRFVAELGEIRGLWINQDACKIGLAISIETDHKMAYGEVLQPYIFTQLSHDGRQSVKSDVRYIHTATKAMLPVVKSQHFKSWKVLHDGLSNIKLNDAEIITKYLYQDTLKAAMIFEQLHQIKFEVSQLAILLEMITARISTISPRTPLVSDCIAVFKRMKGVSAFDALVAVCEYWDHQHKYRNPQSAWNSIYGGIAYRYKNLFYQKLTANLERIYNG